MSSSNLNIQQLEYQFVGPINLDIHSTQCIGLSGESGSGKSLLLRAVADLDEHKGDVLLNGLNANEMSAPEWRGRVAMLPADSQWWFDTVGEHFDNYDKKLLSELGFEEEALMWSIGRISTGEKQRLALLRLLEKKPAVLLLDEPTANLDKKNTLIFESIVQNYLQKNNACAIWVSHDLVQLERVSKSRFKLESGQLVKQVC
jgi:UDP-glucose/iron transport system ATP-binding protein